MCTTSVVDTVGKFEKSSIRKFVAFLTSLSSKVNIKINFFFKFTLRFQQSDSVPIICHRGVIDKFATGINDTSGIGGRFAAGVDDTGGAP
jgi:hypothetical protein